MLTTFDSGRWLGLVGFCFMKAAAACAAAAAAALQQRGHTLAVCLLDGGLQRKTVHKVIRFVGLKNVMERIGP